MNTNTTERFSFSAGRVVKGSVRRELQRAGYAAGLEVVIREQKGLLDSSFVVAVTGGERIVPRFVLACQRYLDQVAE